MLHGTFSHTSLTLYQVTVGFIRLMGSLLQSPVKVSRSNVAAEGLVSHLRASRLKTQLDIIASYQEIR